MKYVLTEIGMMRIEVYNNTICYCYFDPCIVAGQEYHAKVKVEYIEEQWLVYGQHCTTLPDQTADALIRGVAHAEFRMWVAGHKAEVLTEHKKHLQERIKLISQSLARDMVECESKRLKIAQYQSELEGLC